jgi:hypothetical protein
MPRRLDRASIVRVVSCSERGDGVADQPRDVHLREAHALGDLALEEILLEAQAQHDALSVGQIGEHEVEVGGVFGADVAGVVVRQELRAGAFAFVVVVQRPVE